MTREMESGILSLYHEMVVDNMYHCQYNITYALKDGKTVHISEVESGEGCGCVCSSCGKPLIAKKGKIREHHFAHRKNQCCEYGYESSLHLMAKEILLKHKGECMIVPPVWLHFKSFDEDSERADEQIFDSTKISIDNVIIEKSMGNMIPDVIIESGGKQFYIEIAVTHAIDDEKLEKIKKHDVSVMEIDLHGIEIISPSELEKILIENDDRKKWKYNRQEKIYMDKLRKECEYLKVQIKNLHYGNVYLIDWCPLKKRSYYGVPYANIHFDCINCKYCIFWEGDGIWCAGKSRVATIRDLRLSRDERIKRSNEELKQEKLAEELSLINGICPKCGNELIECFNDQRKSTYYICKSSKNYCGYTEDGYTVEKLKRKHNK